VPLKDAFSPGEEVEVVVVELMLVELRLISVTEDVAEFVVVDVDMVKLEVEFASKPDVVVLFD
jgi:hypothetical protein